jgi:exodeoxyribonuclease VII large subunit
VTREVRHDGVGALEVRFPFDRALVELLKTLPKRRWNAAERFWSVPEADVVRLVDLLEPERFRFDARTRETYRAFGGRLLLDGAEPETAPAPRLPGLFDGLDEPRGASEPARAGAAGDYTVSALNERVREVIEGAFPQPVWLVGEISGFNRNAHKSHVGFQLVEQDASGRTVSKVDATVFERTRREIERQLAQAGDPFRLEDEVTVRVRASVGLYVPWGAYRVVVEELDLAYTLGEAARRREEILRLLAAEGLLGLNAARPLPALPLAVGLVTSLGSDAYNDVLRTFQESGFAFRVVAHGARVQGHATEPSVLNALEALAARAADLDVVLICRGGGSRTDLAWFDSAALGRAVARFPLPVIVGIGHEQDRSVLDEVARRAKTPTAAAQLLVETVRRSLEAVEAVGTATLAVAARHLAEERRRGTERGRRLGLAARSLLAREAVRGAHRRERARRGAFALLARASERLDRFVRDIPRAVSIQLSRDRTFLIHAWRTLGQAARRDLAAARRGVETFSRALTPVARRRVERERERGAARERRLHLVDPRRVIERGYAILRGPEGRVLSEAAAAPAGTAVSAQLKHGALRLRSEGAAGLAGGD